MTQIWKDEDKKAVTKVQVGPCKVIQVKTGETDGYEAVQLGFGTKKQKNIRKPQLGHYKGMGDFRYVREFRLDKHNDAKPEIKVGDVINASTFEAGDIVRVTATSIGKGFQGVVKRHGFRGQKETHGTKDQVRMPGSAGATGPAHVFKGMRMPGQMGDKRITITNLEIVEVDTENNIVFLNGSVPGADNGLVMIAGKGDLKIVADKPEVVEAPIVEETVVAEETVVETPVEEVKEEAPVAEEVAEQVVEEPKEEVVVAETPTEEVIEKTEETKEA